MVYVYIKEKLTLDFFQLFCLVKVYTCLVIKYNYECNKNIFAAPHLPDL